MIIGSSGCGEINPLFNLIIREKDIDKITLYAKNPNEVKY